MVEVQPHPIALRFNEVRILDILLIDFKTGGQQARNIQEDN